MGGMVGSKLGWKEAPYLQAPVALARLGDGLCSVGEIGNAVIWIVPGVARDDTAQPEVMRGEECEILGALQSTGADSGLFLLPGTHTKWAIVEQGRLVDFRTYMTGELFGLLRKSGTLSQLMEGESLDEAAFRRGVGHATSPDSGHLLHSLFSVRTLGLLDRLPRAGLPGYMSGLLIGTEIRDAAAWLKARGGGLTVTGIGAPALLRAYREAATLCDLQLTELDSAELLPRALFSIAAAAGLLRKS
jgi:2-dehydro-3-deoxygalactonokinase